MVKQIDKSNEYYKYFRFIVNFLASSYTNEKTAFLNNLKFHINDNIELELFKKHIENYSITHDFLISDKNLKNCILNESKLNKHEFQKLRNNIEKVKNELKQKIIADNFLFDMNLILKNVLDRACPI